MTNQNTFLAAADVGNTFKSQDLPFIIFSQKFIISIILVIKDANKQIGL